MLEKIPSGLGQASAEIPAGRAGANHQEAHVAFLLVSVSSRRGLAIAEGSAFLVDLNKSMAISSRGKPRVTSNPPASYTARRLKSISEPDSLPEGGSNPRHLSRRSGFWTPPRLKIAGQGQ